jgi:hypothetical protein
MSIFDDDDEKWLTPDEIARKRDLETLFNPDTPLDSQKARSLYARMSQMQQAIIVEVAREGHYEPFWTAASKNMRYLRERAADRLVAMGLLTKRGKGPGAKYEFTERVKKYRAALGHGETNAD